MTHPDTGEKATMSESIDRTEVARAFAQHRFDKAIPPLARDVSWTILGYMVLEGADAVARTCRDTAGSLHDTVVAWEHCRTVTEDDTVVVDVLGRYAGADGVTAVASCHICEFAGSTITSITSYGIEVDPTSAGAPADAG